MVRWEEKGSSSPPPACVGFSKELISLPGASVSFSVMWASGPLP